MSRLNAHPAEAEPTRSNVTLAVRGGTTKNVRGTVDDLPTTRPTKDGRAVAVNSTCAELLGADGDVSGSSCAMRPIGSAAVTTQRLYESEKLAALRAISAGFAHELGNPLAGIGAMLQLAARRTREPDTRERLQRANASLNQVAHVIRELADFTREDGDVSTVDLNEVLRAALTLARYAHPHVPVTVDFEPDRGVGPLVGSRHHLLQAFLHMAINAYEAVGDRPGRLRIASQARGSENVVSIEDTGAGIPEAAMAHVFEPFFTTKGSTGLGLFVCRHIVMDEFDGSIAVQSEHGVGTSFTVRLPVRGEATAARRHGRGAVSRSD